MAAKNTARLSAKFQLSIPKTLRTARGWQAGQELPKQEDLAGSARGAPPDDYRDRTDRF